METTSNDPQWYKSAIIYQLHVRSFHDGDGDGVGDFRGLIQKLDYLADLGVTTIWLLPFYPSPLRDDGYDIADYLSVNPSYGTLDDFKELLSEAHKRNLRVITELVVNHTSDQHPWFQRARRAPVGSPERDFYVWSDTPDRYAEARIIFKDFEHSNWTWDHVAKQYFWHRFYSHQPDLNFDNIEVQNALFEALDFWLGMGVDGLRLDAVPYLFEREGTNCENLPETHAFLRKLRARIDANYSDRMLLAEANQWPEDAVAYFGNGDECHMAFHFPVMPRMFMGLQMEDRFPIIDILDQTPPIPPGCQWASFLRNHDELTLEMVTDEERDYMYRVYAADPRARINLGIRRRLAPLLGNSRRKIELMTTLLLSLPGTPVIYYGDEIGMGDNFYLGDRNGVRTPMQWSSDRNAGFSRANPQQLFLPVIIDPEYHYEAINVETQEKNLSSLLWWTRRVIAMRKRFDAFGRGGIEFLLPDNSKVLAFVRTYKEEVILVLVNLSRFAQPVEIDLSAYAGRRPVEVFSQNKFPTIRPGSTFFTLAPHDHYWLTLKVQADRFQPSAEAEFPVLEAGGDIDSLLHGSYRAALEQTFLPAWLMSRRWFAGKAHTIRDIQISDVFPVGADAPHARILFVDVTYEDIRPDTYLVPVEVTSGSEARRLLAEAPRSVIARLNQGNVDCVLHDAMERDDFREALLAIIRDKRRVAAPNGQLVGIQGAAFAELSGDDPEALKARVHSVDQSNSSIMYGDRLFLKLYRKVEDGVNPDAELIRFLSERGRFQFVPTFGGTLEFHRPRAESRVLGLLVGQVAHGNEAWAYTVDSVARFFERVLERRPTTLPGADQALLEEVIGGVYPERARLLAMRTGEMHLGLASDSTDPIFAPEPITGQYRRSLYQSMRAMTRRMTLLARKKIGEVPDHYRDEIAGMIDSEAAILEQQGELLNVRIEAVRTRVHGDYHLGQVLYTGKDFIVLDFEGEPARALGERRMKRSPLRDVAGMMRSFHYAAYAALWQRKTFRTEDVAMLEPWAEAWAECISRMFLDAYKATVAGAPFMPADEKAANVLLRALLLEKATYEVVYELNNRPSWVVLPLRGIRALLRDRG
ncbi:MAG TPA: maltose alpha-D-glucosyltransferase [Chthoniobacteraceae bacterium]|nr:maltose alpha-D-glucosyltransferase [Chthoniobacteraceae bacterium]